MKHGIMLTAALLSPLSYASGAAAPGWKIVRDSVNACEISVPENWGQSVVLHKSFGKVSVFHEDTQKAYAEKMISNTPDLVFYVLKSPTASGANPLVTYQASVPGEGYHCTAQINVKPGFPEDDVKKIVTTFKASKP